jgi:cellobiose phosphorylase
MEHVSQLLFQPELLKKDARELSRRHEISEKKKDMVPIKPLLQHDKELLTQAYRVLATSAKENKDISPAAEWLIDNFYIIQEQIVQIETDFPIGFQRNIPHLKSGINKGLPRVYDLVYNLAHHTDNIISIDNLTLYTQHYQQDSTFRLGELWAIPIMVRLVLVNQLAVKATAILKRRESKVEVQDQISNWLEAETGEPSFLLRNIIDWLSAKEDGNQNLSLLVELSLQLGAEGIMTSELKNWFEYRFNSFGTSLDESLREESQRQSKLQVSIQNAVISFRRSTEIEWEEFVEDCSLVDRILKLDPMGVYPLMDHKTKDQYRRTIERLSGRSDYSEIEVAEKVLEITEGNRIDVELTSASRFFDPSVLTTHVGYYLIGNGTKLFREELNYKKTVGEVARNKIEGNTPLYILLILLLTTAFLAMLWFLTGAASNVFLIKMAVIMIAFFPALELSVSTVNRLFAFTLPPRVLPKMMVKFDIPKGDRSLVVVPVILNDVNDVKRHLEKLEITALANPDPGLQFVLLSDFADSNRKIMLSDSHILEAAEQAVDSLNERYSSRYGEKFFVLHRKREWNSSEHKWMGWERKRGKLEQFNHLLCHPDDDHPFHFMYGNFQKNLKQTPVRFVITLDADTRTPPGSIKELIRVASHPLNRAVIDQDMGIVREGYGIIQPRISIAPDSAYKTHFTRFFSGNVGIDIYTTAVSDVYQDLFGYGVFTGKGIYDVCAFDAVLNKRFPEDRILSHDLLESTYIRTALSTDIELFDDYPSNYNSFCKRNHRWVRGDWQIASWLFPGVPGQEGRSKNPINLLSRWKIFDNLRRSLNPLFLMVLFISGWFWLPGSALLWTLLAFGILAFPIYISFSTDILNRPSRIKWKLYFEKVRLNLKVNTIQAISTLAILPHQAILNVDAMVRVWWRLYVSGKHRLEWTPALNAEKVSANSLSSYMRSMAVSIILGTMILVVAILIDPVDLWVIAPISLLWITSPVFAWFLSQPIRDKVPELSFEERMDLRTKARRTWYYFERLMKEEYSWLPPDNDQKDPELPPVARTSPTNIGLALTSIVAAYEMGYITVSDLYSRLEKTLKSLSRLDRYKGHFYNWYEIRTGEVLNPRYISTVDSGNLAAGLITAAQAVESIWHQKNVNGAFWEGLMDTVETVKSVIGEFEEQIRDQADVQLNIETCIQRLTDELNSIDTDTILVEESIPILKSLKHCASQLSASNLMSLRNTLGDDTVEDLMHWLEAPLNQIESYKNELIMTGSELGERSFADRFEGEKPDLVQNLHKQMVTIKEICRNLVEQMDFRFLYIKKRGLFSIGYSVDRAQLDKGSYDLLASEARIASLVAIAKGDVPSEHWFRLGRRLTSLNQNEFLLSWGGTVFEYLMPLLFMRSYPFTLLSHTYKHIIEWQRSYAKRFDRPWGFSESAYNILNMDLNYQYRAFGAPGLGLKRGLAEEFVVAPYATLLALMVDPVSSYRNLKELNELGAFGLRGYYDAIDFTREHLEEGEDYKVVKIYMAHHHGMSMIALVNVLKGWPIHNYFHSDPMIKACELLLQERIPRGIPIKEPHPIDVELEPGEQLSLHHIIENANENDLDDTPPRIHLLSNGKLHAIESHSGSGSLNYRDITLTGWKPDAVEDPLGIFVYIKDVETGSYWSAFHQPVQRKADRYDSWLHNGKIQTSRVDDWIDTTTEICISPDHPIELRKITLTNYSDRERRIELTSYGEIVLNRWESHVAHPAFSKLFVQTDYFAEHHSIIAWRRPRSSDESPVYLVHTLASDDLDRLVEPLQFETERSKFIGRGRSLKNPKAMDSGSQLSGTLGNVSDPIFSIRKIAVIPPGEKIEVTFGTGWAETLEGATKLTDIFDNPFAVERAFDLSVIYNNVELEHIGISSGQFHLFQKLASYVVYNDSKLRAKREVISKNRNQQSHLWGYGISGDLPLVVFRVKQAEQLKYVERMLKGRHFWEHRGLHTDLLILNDHPPSYADEVEKGIQAAMEHHQHRLKDHDHGKVILHRTERLPEEDLTLMLTYASVVLEGSFPNLDELSDQYRNENQISDDITYSRIKPNLNAESDGSRSLKFFNGYGGFTEDGKEYHIFSKRNSETGEPTLPPAPWINVIANPGFGFLVTESGGGYTWSKNSRENKLTSWANDPVLDPPSEAFYLRDELDKKYWSLTPLPAAGESEYEVRHGFGHTTFKHTTMQIRSVLTQFVDVKDPVKISKIKLKNFGSKRRKVSLFSYNEWVMGVRRDQSSRYVLQEFDENFKSLFAQNWYNNEFAGRIAFSSCISYTKENNFSFCTDRLSFIGRNNSLENPESVCKKADLNNEICIADDPCAAFKIETWLEPDEEKEFVFLIGETESRSDAEKLIKYYHEVKNTEKSLTKVTKFWDESLSMIQVTTPDDSLNTVMNGWLQYQTIVCRMWARTGYYQAGGAFGFRDQLQDSMAAMYVDANLTRKQILLHAAHQFPEGDVLHWWHPPTGRGIRSRITDDRLWLPYVVDEYIKFTGDINILDEIVPYISARKLEDDEHEVYLQPHTTTEKGSLYEHCLRSIEVSLKFGVHGIPLIGGGDWNDGMNRVGHEGKGESVWLGFFLYQILVCFAGYAENKNDNDTAHRFREVATKLSNNLNENGWDGEWYLRAFYDDGTPLGSSRNTECRIDAISQSWAVISGVATPDKASKALTALEENLVSEEDGIIRLLYPPFDKTEKDPGYIKGYIPGVRENGGQYTHAALWAIKALAESGRGEKAIKYLHMINPVNFGRDPQKIEAYKTEPYAVAADVYGEPPYIGQGGWTWYTGSAGWMYKVTLESVLGLKLKGEVMEIRPSIGKQWKSYRVEWMMPDRKTKYIFVVENNEGLETGDLIFEVDGVVRKAKGKTAHINMKQDGSEHHVIVRLVSNVSLKNQEKPI